MTSIATAGKALKISFVIQIPFAILAVKNYLPHSLLGALTYLYYIPTILLANWLLPPAENRFSGTLQLIVGQFLLFGLVIFVILILKQWIGSRRTRLSPARE